MPTALRDVRSQGQSGKHMIELSFSGFDPFRTSARRGVLDVPYDPTVDLSAKRHEIDRLGEKRLRAAFQGFPPGIVVAVDRAFDDGNVRPDGFRLRHEFN